MAIPYTRMIMEVGLRVNAVAGTDPTALDTTYKKVASVTQADFDSGDWPISAIQDLILLAVGRYSWVIADTGDHPFRRFIESTSGVVISGQKIPDVDPAMIPIIGIYGSVRDSLNNTALTEKPLEFIRRINEGTWRVFPYYHFKIDGSRIEHTRPGVMIDVCVFDRANERAHISADGTCVLPDVLEGGIICEAVSMAFRDDSFSTQARQYREYSNDQIGMIERGLTSVSTKSVPGPSLAMAT